MQLMATKYFALYMAAALFAAGFWAAPAYGARDTQKGTCAELCSQQLYEEAFACTEKQYGGFIKRVQHFGDVAIVTATCAYKNADFEIAQRLADLSFTDHPFIWAVMKGTPKKGGSAHRMFVAEVASEKLGQTSKAERYKNLGLQYAKNSGQCEGAKDLQKCAEGYRTDIRRIMGEPTGTGGGKLTESGKIFASFQTACGKNGTFDLATAECTCAEGFKLETKDSKSCILSVPNEFDLESAIDLQLAVEGMAPNSYLKTTLKHKKQGDLAIGVLKQKSGRVLFTLDGEEYFKDLNREFNPSLWNRAGDAWEAVSAVPGDVLDWFSHTKWRDDEEGQYKELQWQIAKEVQEAYQQELKDDKQIFENFRKKIEEYTGYAEWLVWVKELRDQVEDEDISFGDFTDDKLEELFDSMKDSAMTFPGIAIEKFVNEASIEVFSKPVIFYIGERRRGLSLKQIRENDPEELDVFLNEYVRLTFGDALFEKLEESYQRYLLAREFDRKK